MCSTDMDLMKQDKKASNYLEMNRNFNYNKMNKTNIRNVARIDKKSETK